MYSNDATDNDNISRETEGNDNVSRETAGNDNVSRETAGNIVIGACGGGQRKSYSTKLGM